MAQIQIYSNLSNLLCHLTPLCIIEKLLSYREAYALTKLENRVMMCSCVLALCAATEWRTHDPVNIALLYILALLYSLRMK